MKIIYLIIVSIFITSSTLAQSNEVWLETDAQKIVEVGNDNVGEDVKADITCSAETVTDCKLKARKIALYELIFKGYNQSANGGSAIGKLIADMSVYSQNKDFFIAYINEEAKGLQFVQGIINVSKPGGEIKEGKKKLKMVTCTITLKIEQIRKDLESQGMIKSLSSVVASLGDIQPNIVVVPDDVWLKELGYLTQIDNQGVKQTNRDYSRVGENKDYADIFQSIARNFGDGFTITSIAAQLDGISNEKLQNASSDVELVESNDDYLARTLKADIFLQVGFVKETVSGGAESQFRITFNGVDPMTKSASDMPGQKITKKTSGDNFSELLDATLKIACNDFKAVALKYLVKRNDEGLPGKLLVKINSNLEMDFNSQITVEGEKLALSQLVNDAVEKCAKSYKKSGSTTKSRIEFDVKIDPKVTNKRTKKVSANDYEKFAWQVVNDEYLSKFATADVKLNGTGMAIITLKKKEAE